MASAMLLLALDTSATPEDRSTDRAGNRFPAASMARAAARLGLTGVAFHAFRGYVRKVDYAEAFPIMPNGPTDSGWVRLLCIRIVEAVSRGEM
jgi:hypothetical protein